MVNPAVLEDILKYLIRRLDSETAKSTELKQRVEIMQNSMFETLSKEIDTKVSNFVKDYDEVISGLEEKLDEYKTENFQLRRVWDSHLKTIRDDIMEDDVNSIKSSSGSSTCSSPSEINVSSENRTVSMDNLIAEIEDIKTSMHKLDVRLVECEAYPRRESLVISGIPGNITQDRLESYVLDILYYMGINEINSADISACHRLFNHPDSRYPTRVIVRFVNRKFVDWCLKNQSNLQYVKEEMGLDLRIFDSLCAKNVQSMKLCKKLHEDGKISKYFTRNGFMKVIVDEGDNPWRISHPKLLMDKFDIQVDD